MVLQKKSILDTTVKITFYLACIIKFIKFKKSRVTHWGFIHITNSNHLVQHNKRYHMKVLLNSFHMNGNTLGYYPHNKFEPPCTA